MKGLKLACLSIILLLFFPLKTYAQEENNQLMSGFSYEVVQPANQLNKNVGYYDLLMQKGQKQKVELILHNTNQKALDVSIKLNSAKTNGNGVIDYGPNDLKEDVSLKHKFTDIVKAPERVTVPARSDKKVVIEIAMPEDTVEGLIAGGIQLQIIDEKDEKKATEKEVVQNKFAYLIGFLLSESDTQTIKPELKFNRAYAKVYDGQYTLFLNYSNTRPIYVENMGVEIKVFKKNSNKELFQMKKNDLRMAPNSMIDFPISLADKNFVKGEYTLKADVKLATGENWKWEKNFKVTQDDLSTLAVQKKQMRPESSNSWYKWLFSGIFIVFLITTPVAFFIIKRRK
ncbi:hypothetical protein IGL98_003264 [Enterococcus sp. DIV0840]